MLSNCANFTFFSFFLISKYRTIFVLSFRFTEKYSCDILWASIRHVERTTRWSSQYEQNIWNFQMNTRSGTKDESFFGVWSFFLVLHFCNRLFVLFSFECHRFGWLTRAQIRRFEVLNICADCWAKTFYYADCRMNGVNSIKR